MLFILHSLRNLTPINLHLHPGLSSQFISLGIPSPSSFYHYSSSNHNKTETLSHSNQHIPSSKSLSPSIHLAANIKPPPYLPRPLGLEKPPSSKPPTKHEKLEKLIDTHARLEERKHLLSQVSKGYYHDWNSLRHNGNKLWTAPPSLIQEQRALYFPNISGISLLNQEKSHTTNLFSNKVSLIAIESTRMSEEHTRSYYIELTRMMANQPDFQLIRLNIQENPLKSWLVGLFINNLRKSVPEYQHSKYILSNQSLEYIREPLGMVNKLLGYVYLIDWNKKVRWAGCGFANADEIRGLFSSTNVLLKRFQDQNQISK
ncbi:hypothetical protein O181_070485 [Austropuccinia psidii MF-1]|uniref:Mitochondrial ATPase complex subunit ATP10 n=1 Tax=Austropuccinia psidii MF-1 TaxID=1389203 RepID=A0A9Q3I940_9BASI|nr:hypothetical protein [Austropuccinia psidii MF-1]